MTHFDSVASQPTQISRSSYLFLASVERSSSQVRLIKTRLLSCLGELSLSNLMKIAIESSDTLLDSDLEEIVYGIGKTELLSNI